MTRRFIVLALMLLAVPQARAVVEVEMPLAQLIKDSQIIAVVRLEQVDREKARGSLNMESGGVLSHGAIVAREFGIPAVAGIANVHRRLQSGQRLKVDGRTGKVHVYDPPASA